MALGSQVVYFVRFYSLNDAYERTAVGHIAVVQIDKSFLMHITHPLVQVQVFNPSGVERR